MREDERFIIYSRKSKFTGKGESIANQVEMCRAYIRMSFGEQAAENAVLFEDEGFSGGNLARPRFQEMMRTVRREKYRAVVVYRLDRISRNIGDFANLIKELESYQVDFISVKEQFDTSSPMGRAMMYISSVFSQLERETIAERIRDNLHELAKTGRWLGGNPPTGYESQNITSVTIDGRQKKACMLKEIPEELDLVELLFDKFAELQSLSRLDAFLLKGGFHTKNGNDFSRFAVKGILSNPVYMIADEDAWQYFQQRKIPVFADSREFDGTHGIMAYNRTLQKKGKAHQDNPMEEWIIAVGRHQGRIPGSVWVKVQEILERNRSKNYKKPRNNTALLSGILKCRECGSYMRPKQGRLLKNGERAWSYVCTKKERSQGSCCRMKNLNGREADRKILEQFSLLDENKRVFLRELQKGEGRIGKTGVWKCKQEDSQALKAEIKTNQEKIQRLVEILSMAEKGTEKYFLEQIDAISRKNEELKGRITEKKEDGKQDEPDIYSLAEKLLCFGNVIKEMTVEQKRDAVRMLLEDLFWDGEEVHMVLAGAAFPEKILGEGIRIEY